MKKFSISLAILLALFLVGCAAATYKKPIHTDKKENYSVVVNQDFNTVWKKLISYSASTFFAIDNYEKDSGLITLSFGSSNPAEFITGGQWTTKSIAVNFNGDYVDYLSQYQSARLTGRMNIVVSPVNKGHTKVTVNARYVFLNPAKQNIPTTTWTFDTGNCATVKVSNPAINTEPYRTICPTYKAENSIIKAINN